MVFFLYLIINALLAGRIESDWGVIKKNIVARAFSFVVSTSTGFFQDQ
jgi:hypothetical protein